MNTKKITVTKPVERLIRDILAGYNDPFRYYEMPAGWRPALKADLVSRLDNGRVQLTARGLQVAAALADSPYDHKAEPLKIVV